MGCPGGGGLAGGGGAGADGVGGGDGDVDFVAVGQGGEGAGGGCGGAGGHVGGGGVGGVGGGGVAGDGGCRQWWPGGPGHGDLAVAGGGGDVTGNRGGRQRGCGNRRIGPESEAESGGFAAGAVGRGRQTRPIARGGATVASQDRDATIARPSGADALGQLRRRRPLGGGRRLVSPVGHHHAVVGNVVQGWRQMGRRRAGFGRRSEPSDRSCRVSVRVCQDREFGLADFRERDGHCRRSVSCRRLPGVGVGSHGAVGLCAKQAPPGGGLCRGVGVD